jgi:hypothetical protein
MRRIFWWLSGSVMAFATSAIAQDRGLVTPNDALGGPTWQARFERDTAGSWLPVQGAGTLWLPAAQPQTLRLLSDYQFSTFRLGETGGLRLTGGLLVNLRASSLQGLATSDIDSTLPYAGIGYAMGGQQGHWGFSADLGLTAQGLSSLRLDRLFNSAGGLSADGSLRVQPMIRLGMNLAF